MSAPSRREMPSGCPALLPLLAVLVCASGLLVAQDGNRAAAWIWSGAVTTSSAVVKARLTGSGPARLKVSRDVEFTQPVAAGSDAGVLPDDFGVVTFNLAGLEPDTTYFYGLELAGRRVALGRFHTFAEGPMSFRIALASCATTGSDHRIFDTIRELEPLFFLHMGDFHYENIDENDPRLFLDAYDEVLGSQRQSALYRAAPIVYMWDDHDYGRDNADRTSPSREAALTAYQLAVPHYPLTRTGASVETIQQAFTVGRVRFILTDLRAARAPADQVDGREKSMLGKAQLEWFLRQLESAREDAALVVWVSTVPWITKEDEETAEGWAPWSFERRIIANRIVQLGLTERFLILSGDAHMVAIDDGSNSNYSETWPDDRKAFPVFQAAPLDRYPRIKGGPYSNGTSPRWVLISWPKIKQFGLMEVVDDGHDLQVILSGHRSEGETLEGMRLVMRCGEDGCSTGK